MHLERGDSVVADATFLWPSDAEWLNDMARLHEADLVQIWLTADPSVARERFIYRAQNERHLGHADTLEGVLQEFDERFFKKSVTALTPLAVHGRTLIVDTTDFERLVPDDLLVFINI